MFEWHGQYGTPSDNIVTQCDHNPMGHKSFQIFKVALTEYAMAQYALMESW